MQVCRFCKSKIQSDAARCPHCTSFLDAAGTGDSPDRVTYVVDRGLVKFAKFAGALLALFLTVGISLYLVDLKQLRKEVDATYQESRKLDISIRSAQLELEKQTDQIKKDLSQVQQAATNAEAAAAKLKELVRLGVTTYSDLEKLLEKYRDGTLVPKAPDVKQSSSGMKIDRSASRFQIFDAKNGMTLPGVLARSEGDSPVSDDAINQAYESAKVTRDFIETILGSQTAKDLDGKMIVTVHYGMNYNNAFFNGQQHVIGDGDGALFKKYSLGTLSVFASEFALAITNSLNLEQSGQSGAINKSFGSIFGALVVQWNEKQTPEKASWLIGDGVLNGSDAKPFVSLKDPGSASTRQVAHMKQYQDLPNTAASDNGGVNVNAGIPNKAFYELATRAGGFAWETPFKIWWESVRLLPSTATFQELADQTAKEASRLYGSKSKERNAVVQSWAAVGIAAGSKSPK